jgi:hypothetical protein
MGPIQVAFIFGFGYGFLEHHQRTLHNVVFAKNWKITQKTPFNKLSILSLNWLFTPNLMCNFLSLLIFLTLFLFTETSSRTPFPLLCLRLHFPSLSSHLFIFPISLSMAITPAFWQRFEAH